MKAIRSLRIDPRFTLSDKDQSEINALKEVWLSAKHQLCLWHILRALKRRLSQNEHPALYHAFEAHHAFPDIDLAFIPLRQMSADEKVRTDDLLYHTDYSYYITLIMVVQGTVSPPPEKPLARIHLTVNGKPAVITPNLKLTLRVPIVNNKATPAAGNGAAMSTTKGDGGSGDLDLEVNVIMEGDGDHASDGKDGLAHCACKQAASTLKEYEEDGQRLPGNGGYGGEGEDEEGLTSQEIDIIHAAERLALERDKAASDESDDDDASGDSSDSGDNDEGDPDFVPKLKLHGMKLKVPKATRGTERPPNRKRDTSYVFCPLSHRLSVIRLISKHFCQHPILRERHGKTRKPQQIHRDAILEAY